ncbi:MAG: hypothetical protein ACP5OV_06440 [Acidimicrobiales bacterium]
MATPCLVVTPIPEIAVGEALVPVTAPGDGVRVGALEGSRCRQHHNDRVTAGQGVAAKWQKAEGESLAHRGRAGRGTG